MMHPEGFEVGNPAPAPLPRRNEAEVMARWTGDQPLVSIRCATYQHVGFIEDALRGFLGQDTDFPFEILVRDDASTDGTAEIVRDYADRYPNIIRAVLETENRWPEVKPGQVLRPMMRGRFIATCEADDYWLDPSFLQSALDELEAHPTASGVLGRTVVCRDGVITGHEAKQTSKWHYYLPIRALVYPSSITIPRIKGINGDHVVALALQQAGPLRYLDRYVAAYRIHEGGAWSGMSWVESRPRITANHVAIAAYLAEEGSLELARAYQTKALKSVARMLEPFGVISPLESRSRPRRALDRLQRFVRSLRP